MRKIFLCSSLTASIIAVATLVLTSANPNPLSRTNANLKSYGITFDSGRNKFHEHTGITAYDGNATIKTDLGNDIGFAYYQLMGTKSTWHVLNNGGYFYNTDPIHGMQSITLSFNTDGASYSVFYSGGTSFNQSKNFTSKKGGIETFDFDGYQPNYFKILNTSGENLNIPSIRVSLSCLNNNPTIKLVNENEDMGTIEGGGVKKVGSSVTLTATPNKGYRFLGWYDNGILISSESTYTFIIGKDDLSYVGRFTYESYNLVVESESAEKGTVSESSGKYNYLDDVTINASPNKGYSFDGWYSGSTLVSKENPYTFTMPANDYSLVAHFFTKEELIAKYAKEPLVSSDGKTITYGLYPQKNVSDSSLISTLNSLTTPESNGWYLYNEDYYAKASGTPYGSSYKFDNGATISSGTTYWFKCEPIVWNVLSSNCGEYYIVSSILLDACRYNEFYSGTDGSHFANNYQYSEIRAWLNEDFYDSAFALGNSHIQTATVDNGASTTDSTNNTYVCANTKDKVFLPSYKDYISNSYGFSTSTSGTDTRYCKTTDWARARGAWYSTSSSYLYNGLYWTRSPYSGQPYLTWGVDGNGSFIYRFVDSAYCSVRPALSVKIA